MTLLDPGQAKTDTPALSGIAGAMWSALAADPDSSVFANLANLSPCPGGLTAAQIAHRKNLAVMLEAIAKAFGLVFSVGQGSIIPGANSTTILDSNVTTGSQIFPAIIGAPDSTAGEIGATAGAGSVTITSRHNATLTLNVGYFAVNK